MKKQNLRAVCRELGLYENLFSHMKLKNPEKFNYIVNLDDDLAVAYPKYLKQISNMLIELPKMYYELCDKRQLTKFSRFLAKNGLFGSELSFINGVSGVIFKVDPKTKHNTLVTYSKVLELYEEFKK